MYLSLSVFIVFLVLVIVNNEHPQQQDLFLLFCRSISFLLTRFTIFLTREKLAVLTRGTKFLNLLLLLLIIKGSVIIIIRSMPCFLFV